MNERRLPMWMKRYTVGPQVDIRTLPGSIGWKTSFWRVRVLWRQSSILDHGQFGYVNYTLHFRQQFSNLVDHIDLFDCHLPYFQFFKLVSHDHLLCKTKRQTTTPERWSAVRGLSSLVR